VGKHGPDAHTAPVTVRISDHAVSVTFRTVHAIVARLRRAIAARAHRRGSGDRRSIYHDQDVSDIVKKPSGAELGLPPGTRPAIS